MQIGGEGGGSEIAPISFNVNHQPRSQGLSSLPLGWGYERPWERDWIFTALLKSGQENSGQKRTWTLMCDTGAVLCGVVVRAIVSH